MSYPGVIAIQKKVGVARAHAGLDRWRAEPVQDDPVPVEGGRSCRRKDRLLVQLLGPTGLGELLHRRGGHLAQPEQVVGVVVREAWNQRGHY